MLLQACLYKLHIRKISIQKGKLFTPVHSNLAVSVLVIPTKNAYEKKN